MSEAAAHCVVIFAAGPAYLQGLSSREQPYWDEHAAFIDEHTGAGRIVLAGPFADWTGSMLIVRGEQPVVEELFESDPFVEHGVFSAATVRRWLIWVDPRRAFASSG